MWERIKKLFGLSGSRTRKTISPDQVESDDPALREIVARAFNSGKAFVAHVDQNGELQFEEYTSER